MAYPPIADHGLIGHLQTAALDNPTDHNRLTARLIAAMRQ
jgi:hypothetical protein